MPPNKENKTSIYWLLSALALVLLLTSGQSSAAWYQAQGQALIINGDKQSAKKQATEEAIRQALLFAGASVSSTQTLTNGLLEQDALQVTAAGEVRRVEKVSERWHDDFLTVTIRADIFPKFNTCPSNSHLKSITSAPFTVSVRNQLLDGGIQNFHVTLVERLQQLMRDRANHFAVEVVTPFSVDWQNTRSEEQAKALGRQTNSQLVLFGHINDASIARNKKYWPGVIDDVQRHISFRIQLIDAMNGAILLDSQYSAHSNWTFPQFVNVDTRSEVFWNSPYGQSVQNELTQVISDINEAIDCQPTTGRVIEVANNQIAINLGKVHGLEVGDSLSLYQKNILTDQNGTEYTQYNLHPEKLVVASINYDNALMVAEKGGMLGNIQPNDFVTQH